MSGMGSAGPLVTVIMPTHDHATTVDLAVAGVLGQTVESFELVIIGDGVSPEVREAVEGLPADERVRFIDSPKTPSRAELVRHRVIVESTAPYICYTGDDDVLLPDHLAVTLQRLERADFTHPLPVYIGRHGQLEYHPTDLADRNCRDWHLHPGHNAVSLTGVGHRRDSYLKLPYGWREPPPGAYSDHFMWQQWFAHDGFTYSTGDRLTVLKFDSSVRRDFSGEQRRAEIGGWLERAARPDFDAWLHAAAHETVRRSAVGAHLELSHLRGLLDAERHRANVALQDLAAAQTALADEQQRTTEIGRDAAAQRERARLAEERAGLAEEQARAGERRAAEEIGRARQAEEQAAERAARAEETERLIRATKTWRLHDRVVRLLPGR